MKKPRPVIKSELARFKRLCKDIDKARNRLEKVKTAIKTKLDKNKFESLKEVDDIIFKLGEGQDILQEIQDLWAETGMMKSQYGFQEKDYLKTQPYARRF